MAACCLLTGKPRGERRELISHRAPLWECTSSVRNSTGARKFATRTFPMQASLRSIRELTRCRYASASECLHALAGIEGEITRGNRKRRRHAGATKAFTTRLALGHIQRALETAALIADFFL